MFKLLLIWRYFITRRVAMLAVGAIALLVMMVLVVLSVMTGLLNDTRSRNHAWTGDMVITRDSLVGFGYYDEFMTELRNSPVVDNAAAVVHTFGLLSEGTAVELYGIRLDEFCQTTNFADTLYHQKQNKNANFQVPEIGLGLTPQQASNGCIMGIYQLPSGWDTRSLEIMHDNYLIPGGGAAWTVTVFGLTWRGTLAGTGAGASEKFYYVDDSQSSLVDIDRMAMYIDFAQLQRLAWMDGSDGGIKRAHEIRVKLSENVSLNHALHEIETLWQNFKNKWGHEPQGNLLADVKVQTWKQFRRSHIAVAENEKAMMVVVFVLVGSMAVFIIFAIFYMIVLEKYRDLGVIKSLGGSSWAVSSLFLGYGLLVGITGSALGTAAGVLIVTHSNNIEALLNRHWGFRLWDPTMYAISRIPDVVDVSQAAAIVLCAVLACVLGALIPALRAGRLPAVNALRVE